MMTLRMLVSKFRKYLSHGIFLLLLSAFVAYTYRDMFAGFYQQDEWAVLGRTMAQGWWDVVADLTPLRILLGEGRVLARSLSFPLFRSVPLQVVPAATVSLFMHLLNIVLLALFLRILGKKWLIIAFTLPFFAVSHISHQSVSWISAQATLFATATILGSAFFFLQGCQSDKKSKFFWSFFLLYFSLHFKEIGLLLFALFPLLFFLYSPQTSMYRFIRIYAPFFVYGASSVLYRLYLLKSAPTVVGTFIPGSSTNFLYSVLSHLVLYPLTSVSQLIIPIPWMLSLVHFLMRVTYPDLYAAVNATQVVTTIGLDFLSSAITLLFLFACVVAGYFWKNDRKELFLGIAIAILSFLPYAVLNRGYSYMDSRYYYLGCLGIAIVIGIFVEKLFSALPKYVNSVVIMLYVAYLLLQSNSIQSLLAEQRIVAQQRKNVVEQFTNMNFELKKKNVFVILPTPPQKPDPEVLPFAQGTGYTLMVLLFKSTYIPSEFLTNWFLWDLGTTGYKESGEFGFGYFTDMESAQKAMEAYRLDDESLFVIQYARAENKLTDLTDAMRKQNGQAQWRVGQ